MYMGEVLWGKCMYMGGVGYSVKIRVYDWVSFGEPYIYITHTKKMNLHFCVLEFTLVIWPI